MKKQQALLLKWKIQKLRAKKVKLLLKLPELQQEGAQKINHYKSKTLDNKEQQKHSLVKQQC